MCVCVCVLPLPHIRRSTTLTSVHWSMPSPTKTPLTVTPRCVLVCLCVCVLTWYEVLCACLPLPSPQVVCTLPELAVVGLHFLGPNAGEVIQGFATAMRWEGGRGGEGSGGEGEGREGKVMTRLVCQWLLSSVLNTTYSGWEKELECVVWCIAQVLCSLYM